MVLSNECYLQTTCGKFKRGGCDPNSFCIKLFKVNTLFDLALFSEVQRKRIELHADSNGTDREQFVQLHQIEVNIENFIQNGTNLYLYSANPGNGKTSWCLRLAQDYINQIWHKTELKCRVLFISVPKFFIMLKQSLNNNNEYIEHIKKNVFDCDLVIWDDIGTKIGTEFEMENLLNIVDSRLSNGKSNFYTSNIFPKELIERVGERLYSRIAHLSTCIQFNGMDKRGLK